MPRLNYQRHSETVCTIQNEKLCVFGGRLDSIYTINYYEIYTFNNHFWESFQLELPNPLSNYFFSYSIDDRNIILLSENRSNNSKDATIMIENFDYLSKSIALRQSIKNTNTLMRGTTYSYNKLYYINKDQSTLHSLTNLDLKSTLCQNLDFESSDWWCSTVSYIETPSKENN